MNGLATTVSNYGKEIAMRTLVIAGVVLMATTGLAQLTPAPGFGYFRCLCQPGLPSQAPTPSFFAPTISSWSGTVYALTDLDARMKAKNACIAENRGSTLICDSCLCQK
ncbi:MAG TPA: hypothetical protein VL403_18320 [Candidatus Kryptonia bacterium]|nr:hypothetical protein [Candidatus Kryptonia bacterium]